MSGGIYQHNERVYNESISSVNSFCRINSIMLFSSDVKLDCCFVSLAVWAAASVLATCTESLLSLTFRRLFLLLQFPRRNHL